MSSPPKANPFQAKIRKLYLKLFRSVKSDEAKLNIAKAFGTFAMQNYTGHFREPEIESFLSDYSNRRFNNTSETKPLDEKILIHIISKTFEIGGHSRFLENLIQLDDEHVHHLIVTDQCETQPRENIYTLIKEKKGTITHLDGSTDNKAEQLLVTVSVLGGKIMLHHHPNDIIPSISLPALKNKYPIFLFNHSDHTYSFGFELSPVVINIREEAARISYHWRRCSRNAVLPLPIIKREILRSKADVFKKFGLDPKLKLGLCIAGMHKLVPSGEYNFFRTMHKALSENMDLQVAIIGVTKEKLVEYGLDQFHHPRFHFLGVIEDPSEIQAYADLAIDPIPMGSYTALLETCWYGALPIIPYNPLPLFDLSKDDGIGEQFSPQLSEREYLNEISRLLIQPSLVIDVSKQKLQSIHNSEEFKKNLWNCLEIKNEYEKIQIPHKGDQWNRLLKEEDKITFQLFNLIEKNLKELGNKKYLLLLQFSLVKAASKKRIVNFMIRS